MREYIEERAVEIANYIIENNATVRQTAKQFRISTIKEDIQSETRTLRGDCSNAGGNR